MNTLNRFTTGLLLLILAQMMVSLNIVLSKYLLSSLPIQFILALRFTLATVILLPIHWLTPAKKIPLSIYFLRLNQKDWFFIVAAALSAGVLFNVLILWGLHYTDANVAGVITSALPAIIAIMSWIILGENISGQKAIGVIFTTLGLLVIAYNKLSGPVTHSLWGDMLILTSLLPEAMYYILSKMHVNVLPVFLMSSLLNGVNAILFCLSFSTWGNLSLHGLDWIILILLGLSSGLFFVFWTVGCQKVDSVLASLTTAIMPLTTVIMAWMLLGEQLSMGQTIGMAMVICSIAACAKR
jgi:drug/metabolite transporter (DMT)-like permease